MTSTELHRLAVTEVDEDGYPAFKITHCPKTDGCAVWHECKIDGCEPPQDIEDAEDGDHVRHGLVHRYLDFGWFTRDDPHNCGVDFAEEWDWPDDVALGEYTFDVDYEDGNWYPVGIERADVAEGQS